jgi:DnaA regulatory inactivator Hda
MPEQLPFDLGHRDAFAREDFWVSDSNRDAVAWIDKWPAWPAPAVVIYGPAGSGKTHLLEVWKKESSAVPFDPAGSAGMNALIVDDADRLIGDPAREEALFHAYNILRENGGHMLLAAAAPQSGWRFALPDLKSRLLAAPAVQIGSPDDQLLAVVLTKLFSDRQIFVPQDVVQFIVPRIKRSFEEAGKLVERIDRRALARKNAVTIPLVRDLLAENGDPA